MSSLSSDIRYLNRNEIDISRWDHCVIHAPNGLLYARAFYLDAMAENWSALVAGDYQQVMPLTWNKKYGISYLYQPYFTKALGVFGDSSVSLEISAFLRAIPEKFRFWEIDLNENNFISRDHPRYAIKQTARTNYFLSLRDDYSSICLHYKRLALRMKKKAIDRRIQITRGREPGYVISLYRKDYANRHRAISSDKYEKLSACMETAVKNDLVQTYLALSSSGEILAYYIILKDEKYIYSLLGGSTTQGKQEGAFYLLTDAIIQDHAGSGKTFRFEGSDIPGVSFFDALFGPEKISYPHLVMNNLPFPLKYFK